MKKSKSAKGCVPTGTAPKTTPKEVMGSQGVPAKVANGPKPKTANKAKRFPQ